MDNHFKLIREDRTPILNSKGKVVAESLHSTTYEEIKRTMEIMQSRVETVLDVEDMTKAVIMFVYNNQSLAIDYEAGKTELVRILGRVIGFIEEVDEETLGTLAERESQRLTLPRINKNKNSINNEEYKGNSERDLADEEVFPQPVKYELRGLGCNGEIIKNDDNLNIVMDINELSEMEVTTKWCNWLDEATDFLDNEEKLHSDGFAKALLQLFDKEDKICWNYLYISGKTMSEDIIKEILTTIKEIETNKNNKTTKMSVF